MLSSGFCTHQILISKLQQLYCVVNIFQEIKIKEYGRKLQILSVTPRKMSLSGAATQGYTETVLFLNYLTMIFHYALCSCSKRKMPLNEKLQIR
jgi:hypothetical protein